MRKIVLKNFHHDPHGDSNLYEDQLGWCQGDYDEAMASTPEEVLRHNLDIGYDTYFFYPKNMSMYFISLNWAPGIELIKLSPKKDWDGQFIEDGFEFHYIGTRKHWNYDNVIFRCDTIDELIRDAVIDGTPISEVVARSWIEFS